MYYRRHWKSLCMVVILLVLFDVFLIISDKNNKARLLQVRHSFTKKQNYLLNVLNEELVKNKVKPTAVINAVIQDQVCVHPSLEPFGCHVIQYVEKETPLTCPETQDWIIIEDRKIVLNIPETETGKFGTISCYVSVIERFNDKNVTFQPPVYFGNSSTIHLAQDFFKLTCTSSTNEEIHVRYYSGIAPKLKALQRESKQKSKGLGLNVLALGFDSVSHMSFLRNLPKSYEYLTNTMKAVVLNGYNIVGDATFKALCPLLTGKTDKELPSTLQIDNQRQPIDVYPFIWKDYEQEGYVTAYAEDVPHIGTFQYRRSGFDQQPTDHYMRTYYVAEGMSQHIPLDKQFCRGSKHRYLVFLDWIKDFFSAYSSKPKFTFGFHSEQSHSDNINLVSTVDKDLLIGLKSLVTGGFLDNTLFILFGDHGSRFTGLRATLQGKQEERRPFMAFVLPKWFREKYPRAINNLQINVNRLSTPFDIHATLKEILSYTGDGMGDTSQRGISLFKEIPKSRSCRDAHIQPHWCACLKWHPLAKSEGVAISAAQHLVQHINHITNSFRHKCAELKLQNLTRALQLIPTQNLLKFKGSIGVDKLEEDFSDQMSADITHYQIDIVVRPGGGLFEATLTYQKSLRKFTVKTAEISRLNKYGKTSACILEEKGDLRKFCVCH